jgi:aspartate carbamoyltransferase catalytic subunit
VKRDLITIHDLSNRALEGLMDLADEIRPNLRSWRSELQGFLMGSLFLEPSTRTRLSFETAMMRLGGKVITSADVSTSSAAKGESLGDTVRIVDSYVDLTVLRHPAAGAARLASRYAHRPIINAGDGGHEHPTQTLCDLYTLRAEKGRVRQLTVMLYGDLLYARTTHSLARALVRFGSSIVAVAQPGLDLPDFVIEDLARIPGYALRHVLITDMADVLQRDRVPALLIDREERLPPASPDGAPVLHHLGAATIDAIYVTRLQRERYAPVDAARTLELPILDHRFLIAPQFRDTVVLHPLPRVGEIAPEFDRDPRAAYFRQAALGVPIRMALILWALGKASLPQGESPAPEEPAVTGFRCLNPACISVQESAVIPPEVTTLGGIPRCLFCETRAEPL